MLPLLVSAGHAAAGFSDLDVAARIPDVQIAAGGLILMFPLLVSAFTAAIGGPDWMSHPNFSHSEFCLYLQPEFEPLEVWRRHVSTAESIRMFPPELKASRASDAAEADRSARGFGGHIAPLLDPDVATGIRCLDFPLPFCTLIVPLEVRATRSLPASSTAMLPPNQWLNPTGNMPSLIDPLDVRAVA